MKIHNILKRIRVIKSVTLQELGNSLGLSKSHLCEIELGNRTLSLEILEKYCTYFKIPAWVIVFSSEDPNPEKLRGIVSSEIITLMKVATNY